MYVSSTVAYGGIRWHTAGQKIFFRRMKRGRIRSRRRTTILVIGGLFFVSLTLIAAICGTDKTGGPFFEVVLVQN